MIKYTQSNLNNKPELGQKKLVCKFGLNKDLTFETAVQICLRHLVKYISWSLKAQTEALQLSVVYSVLEYLGKCAL